MDAHEPDSFRLVRRLGDETMIAQFDQPRVTLGRATECDLAIPVADVSRSHAVIQRDPDGWTIVDLESTYGTFVAGKRITRHRLAPGDTMTLGLGDAVVTFHPGIGPLPDPRQIVFDDEAPEDNIRMTISVEQFERAMDRAEDRIDPAARNGESALGADTRVPEPPPTEPLHRRTDGVSMVGLFKQVGEVLLSSESLDEMLGHVVDIALGNLPAARGFICLCDEAAEKITPVATRVKGSATGGPISISRSIARESVRARQALLVSNAPDDARFARAQSVMLMDIRSAMCAPLYHAGKVEGLIYVDTVGSDAQFVARDLEVLTALGVLTAVGILQTRLRDDIDRERTIRARLSRYSSPRVVEQIVADHSAPDGAMLAEQRDVSVLFADLTGFTAMAEGMEPAEVARLLNCTFEKLTEVVFQFDGTLDKYMGDGLLAIFGAPLAQPDHARRAVGAALGMQQALQHCKATGREPLRLRIGINSGAAVAGDIGSPIRKDYTVIGDTVNVASRLESSVAQPGQIVIGPETYRQCEDAFECRPLPEIRLKGKQQPVCPYLVVADPAPPERPPTQ